MKDTIYRQAAIDAICKACYGEGDYHKCDGYPETNTWCDELVALRALPSAQPDLSSYSDKLWRNAYERGKAEAQPQRIRGKWIRHKDWVSEGYCEYTCSECDMGVDVMYNYCPRCGTQMDGGEQE